MISCLSFFFLTLEDCKKHEDPKPLTELEKLPPATQVGKNTFGCLVNGKAMVAPFPSYTASFYQQGILEIGGGTWVGPDILDYGVRMDIIEQGYLIQEASYPLTPPPYNNVIFGISKNGNPVCKYENENTITGMLTITKFDNKNYVVSGLFEFTTYHSGCDTIRVSDGRFDLHYAP